MPVGTRGAVTPLHQRAHKARDIEAFLATTYNIILRPEAQTITDTE